MHTSTKYHIVFGCINISNILHMSNYLILNLLFLITALAVAL